MGISYKRRFALLWLATLLLLLAATAVLNRLIDPYGLYEWPLWPGINTVKPRPERALGDIKLANALRMNPDALILGNSRAEIGLDPKVLIQSGVAQRPYNLAIPGSDLETNVRDLQTILAHGIRPKVVIVGLEFFDYLHSGSPASKHVSTQAADAWEKRHLRLQMQSMFTLTALGDSLVTLRAQYASNPATVREDGFNPLQDYLTLAHNEGYFALFRQRGIENARRLKSAQIPSDWSSTTDFAALEHLLHLAKEFDIRLELLMYPYHVQIFGLLKGYELLGPFMQWKQTLSENIQAALMMGIKARLWDFSQINRFSTERIPAKTDYITEPQWYWEAGHFKAALGNLILKQIFAPTDQLQTMNSEQLNASYTLPAEDIEKQLTATLVNRPDIIEDLQEIVSITGFSLSIPAVQH